MSKYIKKIFKILLIVALSLLSLAVVLFFILTNSKLQLHLAQKYLNDFSVKTNTTITVSDIHISIFPPRNLIIKDLTILDSHKDTVLYSKYTMASISKINLHQLEIKNATLDQMEVNLLRDSSGALVLNSILDSLKSVPKDTSLAASTFDFDIKEASISKGKVRYAVDKHTKNDVVVSDINTTVGINLKDSTGMLFKLKEFSLNYENHIKLTEGFADLFVSNGLYSIKNALFRTPNSKLDIAECTFKQLAYTLPDSIPDKYVTQIKINKSRLNTKDLRTFTNLFQGPESSISFSSQITLAPAFIKMDRLLLNYNKTMLRGRLEINDYNDLDNAYIFSSIDSSNANVQDLLSLVYSITNKPINNTYGDLGAIHFRGNVSGFTSSLIAQGVLTTKQGSVIADVAVDSKSNDINIDGTIKSKGINLMTITQGAIPFDSISIDAKVMAKHLNTDSLEYELTGSIEQAFFNNYMYQNILINGQVTSERFLGSMSITGKNGDFTFQGEADRTGKNNIFNFSTTGQHINLYNLHLMNKFPKGELSFNVNSDLNGSDLNNIDGAIEVGGLFFDNGEGDTAKVDNILFESNANSINIYSDIMKGSLTGTYSFDHIANSFKGYLSHFSSSIFPPSDTSKIPALQTVNDFSYSILIKNFKPIIKALKLSTIMADTVRINGAYNELQNKFNTDVSVYNLDVADHFFSDQLHLNISNDTSNLYCNLGVNNLRRRKYTMAKGANIDIKNTIHQNEITNHLSWSYRDSLIHDGAIVLNSLLQEEDNEWKVTTHTNPTQLSIKNTNWLFNFNKLEFKPHRISIDHLTLGDSTQAIDINGIASQNKEEHLDVNLKKIDLDYLANLFDFKKIVNIEGIATGHMEIHQVLDNPFAYCNLNVANMKFNEQPFDLMQLTTEYVPNESKIHVHAKFIAKDKPALVAEGDYDLDKNWLSLDAHLNNLDLSFLREYLGSILQNIEGVGNGDIKVVGPINDLDLVGGAYVKDFSFNIDYLKIAASFSDSIYLSSEGFRFPHVHLKDPDGNTAILSGTIKHNAFSDMKFDLNVKLKNFRAMNTYPKDNSIYYGQAYVTGGCSILGDINLVRIIANVKTNPHTHLYLPIENSGEVSSNHFMTFVDKRTRTPLEVEIEKYNKTKEVSPTLLSLNLKVHATEDAKVDLVFNQVTGEIMKGQGDGNIELVYTPDGEMKMYGNYEVYSGSYLFTLENLVNKKFDIKKGGQLTWKGDPYDANIDVSAEYTIKTSLTNLMGDRLASENTRKRVTVLCGMNLKGKLMHPDVKFDITLPFSDSETQRMVSDILNTTENINKQVGYLLVTNQFYSPAQYQNNGSGQETSQAAAVTGYEMLSNQLSRWLSLANESVNVAFNYRPQSNVSASETEVSINTDLWNNRVTINGNVGYSDQSTTTSNFIGDFDLEIKLNKSGNLLLRTYTHTNDYLLYNSSPTTQGIGIVFKEEFNSFSELIHEYWRYLMGTKKG